MAVAPTKNAERFEWFLEKATEVGVGRHRPAGNRALRTPGLQARAGRTGHHRGVEAVAQGLPSHAASAHALRRSGAMPPKGASSSPTAPRRSRPPGRPTWPARSVRARRPRSSSVPKATSRPAKSPSRWPTVSKRSPSATAAAHRDRGALVGGGHGIGGQRLRIRINF